MPPPVQFRMQVQLALALSHKSAVLDGAAQLAVLTLLVPIADFCRVVGDYGIVFDFLLVAPELFGSRGVLFGLMNNQDVKALARELTIRTLVRRL